MASLEETKGKFKVEGKVKGIANENAFREGFTKNDKPYKSLAFFVETSEINRVRVELFGMEREHVYAYSQKAKESKKIDWSKRHDSHGDFKVMGTSMFLEKGTDGKNVRKVLVEFDAIDYIQNNLKDGDSVRITGQIDFQEYENQQGEKQQSTRFNINSISKIDEINFEAEDFKEVSQFEQEIVVSETMVDDETGKLLVDAKIIKYGGEVVSTTLVVDGEKLPKLAKNMAKRLSFGDFIKTYGLIINATIREEATDEDVMEDDDDWGGDDEIKNSMEASYINNYIQELQVTSVDSSSYEQKKYKEEDLISEEEDAFNGDISSDGDDFDDDDEDDVDDLPFN